MHLLRTLAAAILALGVMPLPEATAQSARLAKKARRSSILAIVHA